MRQAGHSVEERTTRFRPGPEVDIDSAPLRSLDRFYLNEIEPALRDGLFLKSWWHRKIGPWAYQSLTPQKLEQVLESGIHPEIFRLLKPEIYRSVNLGYGFFDVAPLHGHPTPVYGFVQQVFFDHPLAVHHTHDSSNPAHLAALNQHHRAILRQWRDSLREFVWKYFLRSTDVIRHHSPYPETALRPLDNYLAPLSWFYSGKQSEGRGISNHKLYYKNRVDGRVGKFRNVDQGKIDLREVTEVGPYSWIAFRMVNLGPRAPRLQWPPLQPVEPIRYGILSRDFTDQQELDNDEGSSGCYTFGFALSANRQVEKLVRPGFVQIQFAVQTTGRILVRIVFLRVRPTRFTSNSGFLSKAIPPFPVPGMDPLGAFVYLTQGLTSGWAQRNLGFTVPQLQKRILTSGALQFLDVLDSMIYVWRSISDWTDDDAIPSWIKK